MEAFGIVALMVLAFAVGRWDGSTSASDRAWDVLSREVDRCDNDEAWRALRSTRRILVPLGGWPHLRIDWGGWLTTGDYDRGWR